MGSQRLIYSADLEMIVMIVYRFNILHGGFNGPGGLDGPTEGSILIE